MSGSRKRKASSLQANEHAIPPYPYGSVNGSSTMPTIALPNVSFGSYTTPPQPYWNGYPQFSPPGSFQGYPVPVSKDNETVLSRKTVNDPGRDVTGQKLTHNETPQNRFYCSACKLSLDSKKALQSHFDSHIKCSQCSFEGAPKVVKAHHQVAHGKFSQKGFKTVTVAIPGCPVQRFRICVGNRPEDVQKWIEERKKRFPRQKSSTCERSSKSPSKSSCAPEKEKETVGLSALLTGYGSSSEEDEVKEELPTGNHDDTKPSVSQVNEIPTVSEDQSKTRKNTRLCRFFSRTGKCRNGDSCLFLHERQQTPSLRDKTCNRSANRDAPPSLLRSLLSKDINREATISVKLLKYIVETNFLEKNSSNS